MRSLQLEHRSARNRTVGWLVASVLVMAAHAVSATTYISVEPVPNKDVVGEPDLARIPASAMATSNDGASVSSTSASLWTT